MHQPQTERGRRSRDAIIEAAAELMYERGIRATSVEDVLLAAGAGKSQLYHYFGNKDDVAAAVLEHQLATVLEQQAEFRLGTWSGLRGWFDSLLEGQRARDYGGCPVGSLAAEMSAMGPAMAGRVSAAFARWETALQEEFVEMRRHGRLRRNARPEVLATVTLAQIQGGYLMSTASQNLEPMRQALDAAYASLRSYAALHQGARQVEQAGKPTTESRSTERLSGTDGDAGS